MKEQRVRDDERKRADERAQRAEERAQQAEERAQQAEERAEEAEQRVQRAEQQVDEVQGQLQEAEERVVQAEAKAAFALLDLLPNLQGMNCQASKTLWGLLSQRNKLANQLYRLQLTAKIFLGSLQTQQLFPAPCRGSRCNAGLPHTMPQPLKLELQRFVITIIKTKIV